MLLEIGLFLFLSFILFYYHRTKDLGKWKSMGVREPNQPSFLLGNSSMTDKDVFFRKKHPNDILLKHYRQMEGEKVYGTFLFSEPQLVVKDPDLVKQIMVKDFSHFVDHQKPRLEDSKSITDQILSKQMFGATGDEWKDIRSTFSSVFTSGKMKAMMHLINEVSNRLVGKLEAERKEGKEIDLKLMMGMFSMDSIASCAFGVDAQSFINTGKESDFVKNAKAFFKFTITDFMLFIPGMMSIVNALGIGMMRPKEIAFFRSVTMAALQNRKETGTKRNDLVDLLLDAMENPDAKHDKDASEEQTEDDARLPQKSRKLNFDEVTIVATALIFLTAGFDTTSMAMSYALYELAKNPEVQKRLQDEIDNEALEENTQPDYNTIMKMEYLDMVLHETLRKYPPLGLIPRRCTQDYQVPGTSATVHKDEEIGINAYGIHHDPKIYPDPEKFDPERFNKENKGERHPYAFIAFGQGPRACIAMRFALLEMKMAMIAVIRRYHILSTENTVDRVTFDPSASLSGSKHGLFVKVEPR